MFFILKKNYVDKFKTENPEKIKAWFLILSGKIFGKCVSYIKTTYL